MRKSIPNSSDSNIPFQGMEGIGDNRSTADAIIERVSQHVPTHAMPGFYSRNVSEAASDQGHGGLVEGHRKPSDIDGSSAINGDLPHDTSTHDPFIDSLEAFKPDLTEEIGRTAVHSAVAEIDTKNILQQANGDAVLAAALTRANQEKPRD